MKRFIRATTLATAVLLASSGIVFYAGGISSASSGAAAQATTPAPVQEALAVVAASRGSGPLSVDQTAGSVSSGVWVSTTENESVGVAQHWQLRASDGSGEIVLGIVVTDSGTEAVSGWVPGTSQVSNWIFSSSSTSTSAAYQNTVPSTTQYISQPSSSSGSGITPDVVGTCGGTVATPYKYGGDIWYSGAVNCNVPATITDLLRLWDFYNGTTYVLMGSAASAGVTIDYPNATVVCYTGDAARNSFHADMATNITWPVPSTPPTAYEYTVSGSVNLACTDA